MAQKQKNSGDEQRRSEGGHDETPGISSSAGKLVSQIEEVATNNLVYGAHDLTVNLVGLTVAEVQLAYKDVLSVEEDAEAYVNGKLVPNKDDVTIQANDRIQFMKEAGQKGKPLAA